MWEDSNGSVCRCIWHLYSASVWEDFWDFLCIIDVHKFKSSLDGHIILVRIFPKDKFIDVHKFKPSLDGHNILWEYSLGISL